MKKRKETAGHSNQEILKARAFGEYTRIPMDNYISYWNDRPDRTKRRGYRDATRSCLER